MNIEQEKQAVISQMQEAGFSPEEIKKKLRKQELLRDKLQQLQDMKTAQEHESEYLKSHNIKEEHLVPFIEKEIEKEMQKRGKSLEKIHAKMKNNTGFAKKIVDRAIKQYNNWAADDGQ